MRSKEMKRMDVRIVNEPHAPDSAKQVIRDGLAMHNVAMTGQAEYYPVGLYLKTEDGEVMGGLLGNIWAGWLFVDLLWIARPLRGQGHGTALLRAAEALSRGRSCHSVLLDTLSFQAPDFYAKHGYEVWGVLDNCPTGHRRIYMQKSLAEL
jgi:GNAT superfamily N-acetyltransferase